MHSRLGLNEGSLGDCAIRMDSCAYLVGMAGNNSVIRKSGIYAASLHPPPV